MSEKFIQMLEGIKKDLIFMANEVEDLFYKSLKAFETQDVQLAKEVSKADKKINYQEVEIENQILNLMALQQPVAMDLRFMVSALKMNNDLERIGDHAKSIAKSAKKISDKPHLPSSTDIVVLGKLCRSILKDAVQAFINQNTDLAEEISARDKEIDKLNKKLYSEVLVAIEENSDFTLQGVELINVSKHIERIADLSKNLAEEVIFMKDARVIRYGVDKKQTDNG